MESMAEFILNPPEALNLLPLSWILLLVVIVVVSALLLWTRVSQTRPKGTNPRAKSEKAWIFGVLLILVVEAGSTAFFEEFPSDFTANVTSATAPASGAQSRCPSRADSASRGQLRTEPPDTGPYSYLMPVPSWRELANRIPWTLMAGLGCSFAAFLCLSTGVALNGFSQILSGFGPSQQASVESTNAFYLAGVSAIAALVLYVKFFWDRMRSKKVSDSGHLSGSGIATSQAA